MSKGNHFNNSGEILENLQGLPFVPKLYDYDDRGGWHVVQHIHGFTPYHAERGYERVGQVTFNYEQFKEDAHTFFKGSIERGYLPNDINASNVMVDWQGSLWVIDYDFFLGGELPMTESSIRMFKQIEQEFKDLGIYDNAAKKKIEESKRFKFAPLRKNDERIKPLLNVGNEIDILLNS